MNQPLLRLTQTALDKDRYRIEVSLELPGQARQTATSDFSFALTEQDQSDFRWYLEDYLQYPQDPAPQIAARIEQRMAEIGAELFRAILHSSDDARDLWARLRDRLDDTRVEIVTGVSEAAAIPWELLRDPKTDTPLALRARAFVRAHPQPAETPCLPSVPGTEKAAVRILLVICQPDASWRKSEAAEYLGLKRTTLQYRTKEYALKQ